MEVEPGIYDFRLENDSSMVVSGPSKSGKTTFVTQLLKNRDKMFRNPIKNMYWFYGVENGGHEELEALGVVLKKGTPTHADFEQLGANDLIVLDDLQEESKGDEGVTNLFLRGCHHKGFFAITITQYLYGDQQQRKINNNAHYYVIFNNARNQRQMSGFLFTMFPKGNSDLVNKLVMEVQGKYAYLFIDFTPECDERLRLRTNLFTPPMIIFKLEKQGRHGRMDFSRVNVGGDMVGGGAKRMDPMQKHMMAEQRVKEMMNPMQSHVEGIARRIIQNANQLSPQQMRHRTRRLIAFNRIRRLYMGIENKPPPRPMHHPVLPPPIPFKEAKQMKGPGVTMASPSTPKVFEHTRSRAKVRTTPLHPPRLGSPSPPSAPKKKRAARRRFPTESPKPKRRPHSMFAYGVAK